MMIATFSLFLKWVPLATFQTESIVTTFQNITKTCSFGFVDIGEPGRMSMLHDFKAFFKEALHERSHHLHKCLNFGHPNLGDVLKTWSHFKKSPRQRAVRKKILLRWDLDLPIFHTKGVPPPFLVFVRQKWSRYLYDPTFPLLCLFGLRRDFVFGLLSKDISWVGIMEINFLTT